MRENRIFFDKCRFSTVRRNVFLLHAQAQHVHIFILNAQCKGCRLALRISESSIDEKWFGVPYSILAQGQHGFNTIRNTQASSRWLNAVKLLDNGVTSDGVRWAATALEPKYDNAHN
jgi:hypothetical protein